MELSRTKVVIVSSCAEKPRSWTELRRLTGLSHTKISVHLRELVAAGYLVKRDGLYKATEKGLAEAKRFSRLHYAEVAQPLLSYSDLEEFILSKLSGVERAEVLKVPRPLDTLEGGILKILARRFGVETLDLETRHLGGHLARGLDLSIFPQVAGEERKAIINIAFRLISELMKNDSFRYKVAEQGKMSFLLTLDLGDAKSPIKVKSEALRYIFT